MSRHPGAITVAEAWLWIDGSCIYHADQLAMRVSSLVSALLLGGGSYFGILEGPALVIDLEDQGSRWKEMSVFFHVFRE